MGQPVINAPALIDCEEVDLEAGELAPIVAKGFPIQQGGHADRFVTERRNIGKVILTPDRLTASAARGRSLVSARIER